MTNYKDKVLRMSKEGYMTPTPRREMLCLYDPKGGPFHFTVEEPNYIAGNSQKTLYH